MQLVNDAQFLLLFTIFLPARFAASSSPALVIVIVALTSVYASL